MRARIWCVVVAWCLCWCWCWAGARALPPPACRSPRCVASEAGHDENIYYVDGQPLYIKFNGGGYFLMKCVGNVTLEHPGLPVFKELTHLNHVKLVKCPAPYDSYAEALRALNVSLVERLMVSDVDGELSKHHLKGLEKLDTLVFTNARLATDAFEFTTELKNLRLDTVNTPIIERLPKSLKRLLLVNTGVTDLSRTTYAHIKGLESLVVRDETATVTVEAIEPLQHLAIQAVAVFLDVSLPATLVNVSLYEWGESEPIPWMTCENIQSIRIVGAKVKSLPGGWVANCRALRELSLEKAPSLVSVAASALRNASALERVTLSHCALDDIPAELFHDARSLMNLNLSGNNLTSLPIGTFAKTKLLQDLTLSNNKLTSEVFSVLSAVTSLRVLRLDHNAQLGDACDGGVNTVHSPSPLQTLKFLSELYLRNTSARHICPDWLSLTKLQKLDLRTNRIEYITFSDLRFVGKVSVDLRENNVTGLLYSRQDFVQLKASDELCAGASHASVQLSGALRCDCAATWAARALRACPRHVQLRGARCAGGAELLAAEPEDMACAAPPALCPARCACTRRERAAAAGVVLRVTCERAGLARLPPLAPRAATAWELRLAHNRIAEPAALPPDVLELDLRNNSIVDASVAATLLSAATRVRLGGNELNCRCGDEPALTSLRALPSPDAPACAGAVAAAVAGLREPEDCGTRGPGPLLAVALAPLLLAAAVLGGCLARPAWRARLKTVLRGLGWLPRAAEPADDRPYDLFLSFSHHDEELVRGLLARLEGGARPYRVCVHYRDWAPGGWIPAQIAASVRGSRRTVAVVSAHFLRSAWARAEFREAYGAALRSAEPRLVVVLLDEPARLPLDAELRRYLAANTYVRWGDPWFWPKLRAALPAPRGRASPASAEAGEGGTGASTEPGAAAEPLMLQLSPRTLAADSGATDSTTSPLMLRPLASALGSDASAAA